MAAATSGVFLLMVVIILVVAPPSRAFFLPQWYSDEEVSAEYDQPNLEEIPQGAASLAFVFDITGSMHDDLVQVIHGAARILATTLARRDKPLFNYVLVPFHDPGQYIVKPSPIPSLFNVESTRRGFPLGQGQLPSPNLNLAPNFWLHQQYAVHRCSHGVQWVHLHPQGGEKIFFQA